MDKEKQGDHWLIVTIYNINSTIIQGILVVAYAYYAAGWAIGLLVQLLLGWLSIVVAYMYIQSLHRMQALAELSSKGYTIIPISWKQLFKSTTPDEFLIPPSQEAESSAMIEPNISVTHRRIDYCETGSVLFGKTFGIINGLIFLLGLISLLVGWCSIFASSLVSTISIFGLSTCNIYDDSDFDDICRVKYLIYIVLFGVLMIPLLLAEITEQKSIQIIIFGLRLVVILLMVLTLLGAIISDSKFDEGGSNQTKPDLFNFEYIGFCLSIISLSVLFHNFIPQCDHISEERVICSPKICIYSTLFMSAVYASLGILGSYAIDDIEISFNLNWRYYTAGEDQENAVWWAHVIEYTILLYPAFDVATAFPLIIINLADNVFSIKYGHFDAEKVGRNTINYYKFGILVPILITSILFFDLGYVSSLSGSLGIIWMGVSIPLFSIATKRMIPASGPNDDYFCNEKWDWAIIVLSLVIFTAVWTLYAYNSAQ